MQINNTASVKITEPTFLLRGICFKDIVKKYKESSYFNQELPSRKLRPGSSISTVSRTQDDPIYEITDRSNIRVSIVSSNQKNFESYNKKGEIVDGGRCQWCLQDFTGSAIGIPVGYKNIDEKTSVFWTECCFCDFSCCLAKLIQFVTLGESHYSNSMNYLMVLFRRLYPDEELSPAKDWRLLEANGGSLPVDKWKSQKYNFVRTSGLVLAPVKVQYIMEDKPITS